MRYIRGCVKYIKRYQVYQEVAPLLYVFSAVLSTWPHNVSKSAKVLQKSTGIGAHWTPSKQLRYTHFNVSGDKIEIFGVEAIEIVHHYNPFNDF